jgi:perosamine synthetase
MIPVYKPYVTQNMVGHVTSAAESGWFSKGKYNELATELLQERLGVKHVLLTNTGTAATHLVANALASKCDTYGIIMPDNVYVAAWNAFKYDAEAYGIIPISSNIDTWNFDYELVDDAFASNPGASICAVHNVGNVVNVPKLQRRYPNTYIVEDACEGFLGQYEGKPVGTASLAASISFYGNKNITCGEGGAFITNNVEMYEQADLVHGQGQSDERFVHHVLGHNYRMSNIQAALLYGQLECLDEIMAEKKRVFDTYESLLSNRDDIHLQKTDDGTKKSNWMFGVRIPGTNYPDTEKHFNGHGIGVRPMFCPISWHDHLCFPRYDTPSTLLRKECVILPSYPGLTEQDIYHVVNILNKLRLKW